MMTEPKDRLKIARENAGYETPSDAARLIKNININTLISNENGHREISRKMAARYGEAFNVDPGWILYGDQSAPKSNALINVPLISWVSAGEMTEQPTAERFFDYPTIETSRLPDGDWIALRVDGHSMNKISPPDSIIFVNLNDRKLVANACYVIADESGQATYKRFRPSENPPFQPASYLDIPAPHLEGAVRIIGRVKLSIIEM